MTAEPKELQKSLSKLSLSSSTSPTVTLSKPSSKYPKTKAPIADSWEDEELESSSDNELDTAASISAPISTPPHRNYPSAPPPTPVTASSPPIARQDRLSSYEARWGSDTSQMSVETGVNSKRGIGYDDVKRPETTDAVAKRLIAGALGVRAPKRTDEQRTYDKAMREKEVKRREREKEEEKTRALEAERAKAAAWED